jgi:hypothetical protein
VSFSVANRGIVYHCIEVAEGIDARSDFLCTADGLQVALHDVFRPGERPLGVIDPSSVTRVQNDPMTLIDEELARHQPEAS